MASIASHADELASAMHSVLNTVKPMYVGGNHVQPRPAGDQNLPGSLPPYMRK